MIRKVLSRLKSLSTLVLPQKSYSLDDAARYWAQVPTASYKIDSTKLAQSDPATVLKEWEAGLADYMSGWKERGYLPIIEKLKKRFADKTILEIGCGLGFEHVHFFSPAVKQSFLCDIVPSNIAVVNKVLTAKKIKQSRGVLVGPNEKLEVPPLDFIYSHGVLHHVPFDICKTTTIPLYEKFLKENGRFIIMMYTFDLYKHVKAVSVADFARKTEAFTPGHVNPWSEPYDAEKVQKLFGEKFKVVSEEKYNNDCYALYELSRK